MEGRKGQVYKLWKECFHDSEQFMELYFGQRYTDFLNEYIGEGGRVIAALQRIPYSLTFDGMKMPVAYVSGACTHPDYRKRGFMRRLLAQAHRRMFRDGIMFSTLIPAEEWLKDYYARSGYAVCFQQRKQLLTASDLPVENFSGQLAFVEITVGSAWCGEAYRFFARCYSRRNACIQHNWDDFNLILSDLCLEGGTLWGVLHWDTLQGLCFCLPEGEKLTVKESVCEDKCMEYALFGYLLSRYDVSRLECISVSDGVSYEKGMARLIHVEAFLRLIGESRPGNWYFKLEGDEAIPENNGWHNLEKGIYSRGELKGKKYQNVSINELTLWAFRSHFPYMNLMLD